MQRIGSLHREHQKDQEQEARHGHRRINPVHDGGLRQVRTNEFSLGQDREQLVFCELLSPGEHSLDPLGLFGRHVFHGCLETLDEALLLCAQEREAQGDEREEEQPVRVFVERSGCRFHVSTARDGWMVSGVTLRLSTSRSSRNGVKDRRARGGLEGVAPSEA